MKRKVLDRRMENLMRPRLIATLVVAIFMSVQATGAFAFITECSFYTVASCRKEGTSGIMANGKELKDDMFIAASWDYPFGTRLRVRNLVNNKVVEVIVSDRGPNRKLYNRGRKLDISYAAMYKLDGIRRGIIQVEVEVIEGGK